VLAGGKFRLFGSTALFLAGLYALLGYQLWQSYRDLHAQARAVTSNFAATTEAQLDLELRLADVELQEIARDFPVPALQKDGVGRFVSELDHRLGLRNKNFPEVHAFRVFNRDGDLMYSSDGTPASGFHVADRGFFLRLRENPLAGPTIEAVASRSSGQPTLIVARALFDARGRFGGIATAAMGISHFQKRFEALKLPGRDVIAVHDLRDFGGVMRWPEAGGRPFSLPETNPVRRAIASGARSGTATAVSPLDSVPRVFAFRVLERYPFVVLCGLAVEDLLADWKARAVRMSLFALTISALLALLVRRLWRTELKRAQGAMRTRRILENAMDAVVISDSRGEIVGWNAMAAQVFGRGPEAAIKGRFADLFAPSADAQALLGDRRVEMTAMRADGTTFPAEVAISAAGEEEDRVVAAFIHDISQRRERERSLRESEARIAKLNTELEERVDERTRDLTSALRDLETFNYSVSHDLRAPLRAVSGFVGVTLDQFPGQLGPDARKYLERVRLAARSMADIVEGLLALARGSRDALARAPVDLANLARVVFDELDVDPARRVELAVSPTPVAYADPKLMRVVMQNLLANAIKYSRGRDPARIAFQVEECGGATVYVVSDNGAGFDSRYADNLFKPFARLHSASEFEGTGIGLATVHRIIERHSGRIWAESRVGEGAVFRFTLGTVRAPATATPG
jgi:PAS domain S-box-containing protein